MPTQIDGVTYLTATEVAREIGVVRQTLWRWRQAGKIPLGAQRKRDRQILYTVDQLNEIRQFANGIVSEQEDSRQRKLFD